MVVQPPVKETAKLLTSYVKNVAESCREFVRWMDGTCVEMPDQRPAGETEGDPLVLTFNTEVLRIQQVRSSITLATSWAVSCASNPHQPVSMLRKPPPVTPTVTPYATQVMASAVQVHQDITKSGQRISRHLDAWRRYSDIWRTDKAALLDKFKAKAPGCAAFEEKFSKFKKVGGGRLPIRARGSGQHYRRILCLSSPHTPA